MSEILPPVHDASPAPGPRAVFHGRWIVASVLALMASMTMCAVVAPSMALRQNKAELEIYGEMPDFALTDQTGATMSRADLAGTVVIANFIFTRCLSVCPVFTSKMYRVQERTTDVSDDLKLLSFSVDPAYDTPAVLADYAAKHKARSNRWRFLTGAPDDVRRVVTDGLAIAMDDSGTQADGTPNIAHSEYFVLIDDSGLIRGYYNSNDSPRLERMLRDARRLINHKAR